MRNKEPRRGDLPVGAKAPVYSSLIKPSAIPNKGGIELEKWYHMGGDTILYVVGIVNDIALCIHHSVRHETFHLVAWLVEDIANDGDPLEITDLLTTAVLSLKEEYYL